MAEPSTARRMTAPDPPLPRRLTAAFFAGAIAGAAGGLIDGLWGWQGIAQFAAGLSGRLRLLVYVAAAYALASGFLVVCASFTWALLARHTRLGDIAGAAAGAHRRHPAAGLSLAIAGIPTLSCLAAVGYAIAARALTGRHHFGLVIAVAMAIALVAFALGFAASFAAARPVELGLRRLAAGRPGVRDAMSRPGVVLAVALGVTLAMAAAGVAVAWLTLSLLSLRPTAVALVIAVLVIPSRPLGQAIAGALIATRMAVRRGVAPAVATLLAATLLAAGSADATRKSAEAYTGLGAALTRAFQRLSDFDRDGYARFLGGGDCDDWDSGVNPGAAEIPDDGVDNNCVGGDATSTRSVDAVAFAQIPDTVPADFNVLLLTVDTLRADHVGAYGYERKTTPTLDALAAAGAVFESGWAHAPSTRYSIPAILTGRHPLQVEYTPIANQWPGLSMANTTIAEILQARGLRTGAILNYRYFAPLRNMNQGFDHYDNSNQRLHRAVASKGPAETRGSSSRQQTDKAIEFLANNAERRFFLWVHYYDPHFDYERHPGTPSFGGDSPSRIDLYDHEIRYTDEHIGRLVADLKARDLFDRTIIVVTGDHGEGFGEHGIEFHGYHLYAAQTRVPLIIVVPGLPPQRVAMPAAHVDILPTLANLAGAEPTAQMRGRSLVDVLSGDDGPADRVVFQQLSFENNNEQRGAIDARCHVIYNVSPNTSWEFYRLDDDPMEARDLADTPGPCNATRAALEAWYDQSEIPPGAATALLPEPPELDRRLDIAFGDRVRLLAVDIPPSVRRGSSFAATYTWQARGALGDSWRVFAHFEGDGGRGRFMADHPPVRPFSWWRPGDFVGYTVTVTVPAATPAGEYTLWTGLFDGGARQPASSDVVTVVDDRAQAATIRVTP